MATKRVADLRPGDSVPTVKRVVSKYVDADKVSITWDTGESQDFLPDDALPDVKDSED